LAAAAQDEGRTYCDDRHQAGAEREPGSAIGDVPMPSYLGIRWRSWLIVWRRGSANWASRRYLSDRR